MSVRKMPSDHKIGNKWRLGIKPANPFTKEDAVKRIKAGNIFYCATCKVKFNVKPWIEKQNKSLSGNRFCSKKCHAEYKVNFESGKNSKLWVGGKTTYRGKSWTNARKLAVERDKGICQKCFKSVGISIPVHHIKAFRYFENEILANDLGNLICYCQSCHMKIERSLPAHS